MHWQKIEWKIKDALDFINLNIASKAIYDLQLQGGNNFIAISDI